MVHPTGYGSQYSLNPRQIKEIKEILDPTEDQVLVVKQENKKSGMVVRKKGQIGMTKQTCLENPRDHQVNK